MLSVMLVRYCQPARGHEMPFVLKLHDRCFAINAREEDYVEWLAELETEFQNSSRTSTSGAMRNSKLASTSSTTGCTRSESEAYRRMQDMEGFNIPRFYCRVELPEYYCSARYSPYQRSNCLMNRFSSFLSVLL
ncbi:hypothetical protein CC78DRAFT_620894 [Lojkania enalia]|uniref:Uncharacterized protein n=1 Tax=Lojkania enalia TaxID=147567 RepID=A0A9P4JYM1_9PLEO|nr:hypothetical protein CC78DRAFT_620894 [Didymosphaeria enalia]